MYLLQLDPKTGLLRQENELDGWMAIESFRKLVELHGIKALTCVALVMDYGSLIKHYTEKERPHKAMQNVYYNRDALQWFSDEIQLACIHYKELQFDPVLEEKKILDGIRIDKLEEIKNEPDNFKKQNLLRELGQINGLHESFEKKHSTQDFFHKSPVRNGYHLQRLEIKLTDPKSFYHERRQAEQRAKERAEGEQRAAKENNDVKKQSV